MIVMHNSGTRGTIVKKVRNGVQVVIFEPTDDVDTYKHVIENWKYKDLQSIESHIKKLF